MTTFKATILKGKKDVKSDGTTNIKIRVKHKRKSFYFNTNIFVLPKRFNNSKGIVTMGNDKEFLNNVLWNKITEYRASILKIDSTVNYMSTPDLKKFLLNQHSHTTNKIDFFAFARNFAAQVQNKGTQLQYNSTIRSIERFHGHNLYVSEINLQFLNDYLQFNIKNGVNNGIISYFRRFSTLFSRCQEYHNREEENIIPIPYNPFSKFKIPKATINSKKHFLSVSEFRKLKSYSPNNSKHVLAKDMFLLMFYLIGIEAKDLFNLDKPSHDGYITYIRYKTNKKFHFKVQPEAQQIISKYEGKFKCLNISEIFPTHHKFLFFLNSNLNLNNDKTTGIFPHLGINKKVTSKWSRHTWATFARNDCDISMDNISLALGHSFSNNQVTDVYIEHNSSKIDSTNRKVINFVNSL